MEQNNKYTNVQTIILILMRLVIGYHFLETGFDKLYNPDWTSAPFLLQSNWVFSDLFHFLAANQNILAIVDFINIWGQIMIGISLIIGLFSTWAAYSGAFMIFLYYIALPPFVKSNTFIDTNLIEFFALLVIALFSTSKIIGLDLLISKKIGGHSNER